MEPTYIRNRNEAALVARIARAYGYTTSVRDIYEHDRYLINVATRLFGADPRYGTFIYQAHNELMRLRAQRAQR